MKISELIELLDEQQKRYGDNEVQIRDHKSGTKYSVDYVTYWTKEKEYQIGINKDSMKED